MAKRNDLYIYECECCGATFRTKDGIMTHFEDRHIKKL
jgi:hypothetical protein